MAGDSICRDSDRAWVDGTIQQSPGRNKLKPAQGFTGNPASPCQCRRRGLAFERARAHGCRRIGFVTSRRFDRDTCGNFRAGFLAAQDDALPESRTILPLYLGKPAGLEDARRLRDWLRSVAPEAVITTHPALRPLLTQLGVRVPTDLAIAATSVLDDNFGAGVDQNCVAIGCVAMRPLACMIHQNEGGTPRFFRRILVEGQWVDGTSLPPRPRPSYTPPTRNYSSSPPSRSSDRNSSASSYRPAWTPRTESHGQTINRFAEEKRRLETGFFTRKSPLDQSHARAVANRPNSTGNSSPVRSPDPAALRLGPLSPTHDPAAWAQVRAETMGKAPLAAPPRSALESRRAECDHSAPLARARGAAAPWENLRAGQLSLLFQGRGAEPNGALAFFQHANPTRPETQLGLGLCYLRGFGTAPDPDKARAHLEKASGTVLTGRFVHSCHGTGELFPFPSFQAARELGVAYDLGQGLPADPLLALHWYQQADRLPLTVFDRDNLQALRREFWKRHASRARELMERAFAANRAGAPGAQAVSSSALRGLAAAGEAQVLFELGEFVDTKNAKGEETAQGRSGRSYFLAAAAAGDATAHLPLAFHYSGARGQPGDPARASHHATLLPATLPPSRPANSIPKPMPASCRA